MRPDLLRVLEAGFLAVHISDRVRKDPGTWGKTPRPLHGFEVIVLLSPDNKVGSDSVYPERPF